MVAFSALRAVLDSYVPLDDNAVIETRARDVFSARTPLLGSVSSATQLGQGVVNHPGPMLFDLLAIPVRLFPYGTGVALGVALIHIAAIATLGWAVRRFLGEAGACVVLAVVAAFLWSLGSEAWFEVWQPVVTMLPFLLALVSAWGFAAGHDVLAVPAVLAASMAVQTHGSYLLLGPGVLLAALLSRWAIRRPEPLGRRSLAVAGSGGLLVWLQPLVDHVAGSGNMSALLRHATSVDGGRSLGFIDAVRAAAMVLATPPLWLRPGVESSLPNTGGIRPVDGDRVFDPDWVPFPVAAAGLVVLVTVLVGAGIVGRRRGDRVMVSGSVVAMTAVALAVVSLAKLPVDTFGFTAHKARWLWPIGAFVTAYGLVALIRLGVTTNARQASLAAATVGAVALAATLPTARQFVSAQQYMVDSQELARDLREAVDSLDDRGVVFLDLSGRPFPDPFNDTLAAEMASRGIPFRVEGDYVVAQYGPGRRLSDESDVELTVRTFVGSRADDVPASWDIVADISDGTQWVVLATHPGVVRAYGGPTG